MRLLRGAIAVLVLLGVEPCFEVSSALGATDAAATSSGPDQGRTRVASPSSPEAEPSAISTGGGVASSAPPVAAEGSGNAEVPAAPVAEASQRFERGLQLFRDGAYELALIEFERAYELVPNYRVLYNIGQVSIVMGRYAKAMLALQRYLQEGGAEIEPERRAAVEVDLKMLQGRVATVLVMSNVEGAEVLVDQEVVATTPMSKPLLVDAGAHSIEVRKTGWVNNERRVTLAAEDLGRLQLDLQELRPVQERLVVERQLAPAAAPQSSIRPLLLLGWTGTGVLAVGALVTGLVGVDAAGELDNLRKSPTATKGELDDARGRAKTYLLASDLLAASAVVLGGFTLYETLTPSQGSEPEAKPSASGRVGLVPGGVMAWGTF